MTLLTAEEHKMADRYVDEETVEEHAVGNFWHMAGKIAKAGEGWGYRSATFFTVRQLVQAIASARGKTALEVRTADGRGVSYVFNAEIGDCHISIQSRTEYPDPEEDND